ncbi:radical SAM additional 4Fe4S-binding domain protein [Sphaerochaeta pleomorpha str. Grapes]|uniref:Radical SAM additional 4Fe4S-binding domain protein n=2 Tax=Sphaerochaeta TaxID=399320 RepID=G8QV72_SPHPG|nr:radical SAM additional 4Fe4S-binding domain protein [Sphaerochaeta pleomorpha str. Grapes]
MMIKPSSSACNLACSYCFYQDLALKRDIPFHGFMSDEVMASLIEKCLSEAERCSFMFQGGEPSLIGLPFFKRFVETVNRLNETSHSIVNYAFQTNALTLDLPWAEFFKENGFLVGVSFDGNARLHNLYRKDSKGEGTAQKVLQSISLLKEQCVDFNILSVVTPAMAENVRPMWNYLSGHGLPFLQYIPCMDPFGEEPGGTSFSLSPDSYAKFLMQLFDLWYENLAGGKGVSVRFFDNLVSMLVGFQPESCDMTGICSVQYVAESDGSIYPCDFFCVDDYCLGNILSSSITDLDAKRKELQFIESSPNKSLACSTCQWEKLCRGGCKRYRNEGAYRYCTSMQQFFPYAIHRLEQVARTVRQQINTK